MLQETLPNAVICHVIKPRLFASHLEKRSLCCAGSLVCPLRFAWHCRSTGVARILLLQSTDTAGDKTSIFLMKFAPVHRKFCRLLRLQGGCGSFPGGVVCLCSVNKGANVTLMPPYSSSMLVRCAIGQGMKKAVSTCLFCPFPWCAAGL